jgi:hypothetical protein
VKFHKADEPATATATTPLHAGGNQSEVRENAATASETIEIKPTESHTA